MICVFPVKAQSYSFDCDIHSGDIIIPGIATIMVEDISNGSVRKKALAVKARAKTGGSNLFYAFTDVTNGKVFIRMYTNEPFLSNGIPNDNLIERWNFTFQTNYYNNETINKFDVLVVKGKKVSLNEWGLIRINEYENKEGSVSWITSPYEASKWLKIVDVINYFKTNCRGGYTEWFEED